jgi:predicted membrane-bound spermidine synthase
VTSPVGGTASAARASNALAGLFFLSGMAALIYQVCWQRLLFTTFGVDVESVTVVVSTFMLGLGVGALFGGMLADRFSHRTAMVFVLLELAVGAFGIVSSDAIQWAGAAFSAVSLPVLVAVNFVLVGVPASVMGATLPVLVVNRMAHDPNVGTAVGRLYFVNTVGAAFGAASVGFVFFHHLSIDQTIGVAVVLNLTVALVGLVVMGSRGRLAER